MKIKVNPFVVLLAMCPIFFNACQEDDDTPQPTPIPNPTGLICAGNGSTSYMPLALGNYWSLQGQTVTDFSFTVIDTPAIGSATYHEFESAVEGNRYYRRLSNGDIVIYDVATSSELLFIPGTPTVGQQWTYTLDSATTRKVISINDTIITAKCSYTGCLKIQNFDGPTLKGTQYFKKGIGLVSTNVNVLYGVQAKLNSITLN